MPLFPHVFDNIQPISQVHNVCRTPWIVCFEARIAPCCLKAGKSEVTNIIATAAAIISNSETRLGYSVLQSKANRLQVTGARNRCAIASARVPIMSTDVAHKTVFLLAPTWRKQLGIRVPACDQFGPPDARTEKRIIYETKSGGKFSCSVLDSASPPWTYCAK